MAEDLDVEAMLEAPYRKEEDRHSHKTSSSKGKKKKKKSRSRSRERSRKDGKRQKRSRSRDRDRHRDKNDKRRSRSRDRGKREERTSRPSGHVREKGKYSSRRSRSRSRDRHSKKESSPRKSVEDSAPPGLTPEERDVRTVVCMQLASRIRPRDLEEFFSSVGKVNDVRLITDTKTRRSKGIAYIEFKDMESVPLALALCGQKLLGVPLMVQASQAERNRMTMSSSLIPANRPISHGPMRLYVGSLHYNITEDMLKGIFEPFGKVVDVKLMRDHDTGRSLGYGFLTYNSPDDAKKAHEQLNGFELAGRPMKVGNVTDRHTHEAGPPGLDNDEMDRTGFGLGATGRLQLMAKLAEGTGFQIPQYAASALSQATGTNTNIMPVVGQPFNPFPSIPAASAAAAAAATAAIASAAMGSSAPQSIATQCFMLSNMFDINAENHSKWDQDIQDDVIEECNKHGGVVHIFVDKSSPMGNVYVKCTTIAAAIASVNSLHGRYFGGRVITAAYVPLPNYATLFVDSVRATQPLLTSTQAAAR